MNPVADLVVGRLQLKDTRFPKYSKWLAQACDENPPPHGEAWYGTLYRELSRDPVWLANSLLVNAEKEGFGSRQIWKFSNVTPNADFANLIRGHSIDESRHSRMFVKLLEYTFDSAVTDSQRREFFKLSPGYTRLRNPGFFNSSTATFLSANETIDELIQVNLVEIRSLVLQLLLRPVILAHAPEHVHRKIVSMLDDLVADELNHIAYSAQCLESEAAKGHEDFIRYTMITRQADLNNITCEEVGKERFSACGECRACVPMRLQTPSP